MVRTLLLLMAVLAPLALRPAAAAAQQGARPDTAAADTTRRQPPPDPAADSILAALRELPGFVATEYMADSASYRADEGVLRLLGQAQVRRAEGDELQADTIEYFERTELVEARGSPRVRGQAQDLAGNVLFYDLANGRATALGARTTVQESATWFVRGDVTLEGTHRVYATDGTFTTCDLESPHYHFESDRIMIIRDQLLVARPARLYFGKVPVMVLPFVVHNLERGRRSGLLTPRFGVNDVVRTSSGYTRQISDVGWYWAVNDYMDATLSGTWRSGAYTALLGNVQFNWRRQFLNGNLTTQRFWREGGRKELNLNSSANWRPDERTSLALSGQYASSSEFVRQSSIDPREVTQDLNSTLSVNRRFDWGTVSLGADRRQSIATGDVSTTLPSFSITPQPITLFQAPSPELARWYNNVTLSINGSGRRSSQDYSLGTQQDRDETSLQTSQSLTVGNLSLSSSANLGQTLLSQAIGTDSVIPGTEDDRATWNTSLSYRQRLIGSTNISPTVSWSQDLRRQSVLTGNEFIAAPVRTTVGASLNTDLYGFFPGVGGFSAIRHRLSPRLSYGYAPAVQQTTLQERVHGPAGGRARNVVTLSLDQTWEAKLRTAPTPEQTAPAVPDSVAAGDTTGAVPAPTPAAAPLQPEKVTLLSISTSAIEYDFIRAAEEGTGWTTQTLSNTVRSDYLRGLNLQMTHDLFDQSDLNPSDPSSSGRLGRFAPRLSSLSTSFELGPNSSIFRWFRWLGLGLDAENPATQGVFPGTPPDDEPRPPGMGSPGNNPIGTGGGPWSASVSYQYSRAQRTFRPPGTPFDDRGIQTLNGSATFALTPNWGVNWTTSYSITDREFGAHRLNFKRNLHRWEANFNFYQTPNGNSGFEFYVELIDNRDLKFDYRESELGIDRRR